jgi:hypothetical protein
MAQCRQVFAGSYRGDAIFLEEGHLRLSIEFNGAAFLFGVDC